MNPIGVQRSRKKGSKLPPNTVCVSRPSVYGNHWTVYKYYAAGFNGDNSTAIKHCVEAHRAWLNGEDHWAHSNPLPPVPDLTPLRGKNLACWCKLGTPCHRDNLLEAANR